MPFHELNIFITIFIAHIFLQLFGAQIKKDFFHYQGWFHKKGFSFTLV